MSEQTMVKDLESDGPEKPAGGRNFMSFIESFIETNTIDALSNYANTNLSLNQVHQMNNGA